MHVRLFALDCGFMFAGEGKKRGLVGIMGRLTVPQQAKRCASVVCPQASQ